MRPPTMTQRSSSSLSLLLRPCGVVDGPRSAGDAHLGFAHAEEASSNSRRARRDIVKRGPKSAASVRLWRALTVQKRNLNRKPDEFI